VTIRACFFDMGNVLVHFSHDLMCRNIGRLCGWDEQLARDFLFAEGRQWRMERGEMAEEQFHAELSEASGGSFGVDELRLAAADIFTLNEGIVPILQDLKSSRIRLVLLSNTSVTHLRFIEEKFQVLQLMDDRVTSFETGAMKPDDRIFQAALAKSGCTPDECFYTDDILSYVDKGASLGIHSHQFTTNENLHTALRGHGLLGP
jgi:HAD superfamily hydrolase (TIGR01509 family)